MGTGDPLAKRSRSDFGFNAAVSHGSASDIRMLFGGAAPATHAASVLFQDADAHPMPLLPLASHQVASPKPLENTNSSRTAMEEAQASQIQTADKNQVRSNSAASLSVPRVAKREGRVG